MSKDIKEEKSWQQKIIDQFELPKDFFDDNKKTKTVTDEDIDNFNNGSWQNTISSSNSNNKKSRCS
jgi:hypothetical protein